jgi:hypothetical protein
VSLLGLHECTYGEVGHRGGWILGESLCSVATRRCRGSRSRFCQDVLAMGSATGTIYSCFVVSVEIQWLERAITL